MHKDIDRHTTITDYSYLLSQSRIGLDGDRQQVRGLLFEQRSSFIVENVYTYIYIYTRVVRVHGAEHRTLCYPERLVNIPR